MSPEKPTQYRRTGLFAKQLKNCVEPIMRPVLKEQGAAVGKIIGAWAEIVGEKMAAYTLPVKLTFPKQKNNEGTLLVACDSAQALMFQHEIPVLLERLSHYFGYQAVSRIQIEQRAVSAVKKPLSPKPRAQKGIDTRCLDAVDDAELKAALASFSQTLN